MYAMHRCVFPAVLSTPWRLSRSASSAVRQHPTFDVLMFPGQGSQMVGMGKELASTFPASRLVFEEVDETLQQNLSQMMFSGDMVRNYTC